jgi:hypothetical protein
MRSAIDDHPDDPSILFDSLAQQIAEFPIGLKYVVDHLVEHRMNVSSASALMRPVLIKAMQFRNLFQLVQSLDRLKVQHSLSRLLFKLGHEAYPWLPDSAYSNAADHHGKGIVYTASHRHAHYVYLSIKNLRHIGSELPVIVFYIGDEELPLPFRTRLESLPGVTCQDMSDSLNWDMIQPKGWAIKPFALLLSPFQDTVFMDSDVFWFQRPDQFFDDAGYKATGALFFFDRTLPCSGSSCAGHWVRTIVTHPSPRAQQMRVWQMRSGHEQESGVIVLQKRRGLMGLLVACALNAGSLRDTEVYQHVLGDKETFWIGSEIVNEPYSFYPGYGGSIGESFDNAYVCGVLSHSDDQGRPIWFNGGLEVDKRLQRDRLLIITHVVSDPRGENISWVEGNEVNNGYCLRNAHQLPLELNETEFELARWLRSEYLYLKRDAKAKSFWGTLT